MLKRSILRPTWLLGALVTVYYDPRTGLAAIPRAVLDGARVSGGTVLHPEEHRMVTGEV